MTSPHHTRWMIAMLCVALIILRVGGAHLHFCFDGSEPPLSYHIGDSTVHHAGEQEEGESHSDRDVAIGEDLLIKKPFGDQDSAFALFAFAVLLMFLSRPRQASPREPYAPPLPRLSWRLRPPLRGPPTPA